MNRLAALVLLTVAALPATVAAASDCPAPFAKNNVLEVLPDDKRESMHGFYGIYPEPCDGGLYLVSLPDGKRLARINENWWLEDFESARWQSPAHEAIVVVASYITGIGPTGVQPFRARIVITRRPHGWVPDEPELLDEADDQ